MKKVIQLILFLYVLVNSAHAQQIASVDLTHPREPAESAWKHKKTALPKGCEKLLPGMLGDGFVLPSDRGPRDIVLEIVKLSNENPVLGSEIQGEIRLRNSGKYPITIPWSTAPQIIEQDQNPNSIRWEEGRFNVRLRHGNGLENLGQPLFGSRFSPGSELTIRPGEWITAIVEFKLSPQYALPGQSIKKGKVELFVEWEQGAGSKDIKNCTVASSWFQYRDYYRQYNPSVTININ
jgi:hypothetical protein